MKKKLKKLYGWVIVAANTYRSAATFYTNKCAQTRPRARDRSIHSICLFRFNLLSQVIVNTIYCAYSLSRTVPLSLLLLHTCLFSNKPFRSSLSTRLPFYIQQTLVQLLFGHEAAPCIHRRICMYVDVFVYISRSLLQMMRHSILNMPYTLTVH